MQKHWTERSTKDYLFHIVADFIVQLEERMERQGINQDKLAKLLRITKGAVSQVLNKPGNMKLDNIVKYARALGLKVSIVAYDDGDRGNTRGPINSEIFKICWEKQGKPGDFWSIRDDSQSGKTANSVAGGIYHRYVYPDAFKEIVISGTAIPDLEQPQDKLHVAIGG